MKHFALLGLIALSTAAAAETGIPPNTTAIVCVPKTDAASVTESGHPATQANGIKFLHMEKGCDVYEVGSGTYKFIATQ